MEKDNFCVITFPDSDFGAAIRRAAWFFAVQGDLTPTVETFAAVTYAEHIKLAIELSHRKIPVQELYLEYIAESLALNFSQERPQDSTKDVLVVIDLHTQLVY